MESNKEDKNDENVVITIRSVFSTGKEASSLIGNKGYVLRRLREESGARISITDGSCAERIVTVKGSVDNVCSAYNLICRILENGQGRSKPKHGNTSVYEPLILKLIVPAMHCGSLIGKSGSKIKELRDITGANVHVASDMLPFSTERIVTIQGVVNSVTQAIYQICLILIECTMQTTKGAVMPYEPKSTTPGPIIMSKGQAYTIHGEYLVPVEEVGGKKQTHPLAGLAILGLEGSGRSPGITPLALAALAGSQFLKSSPNESEGDNVRVAEIRVSNSQINCVVGKGGSRIFEIRQISGTKIDISKDENCRILRVEGTPEAVSMAQYLVNMCIELHKKKKNSADNFTSDEVEKSIQNFLSSAGNPMGDPKMQKNSLTDIAFGNLAELLANMKSNENQKSVKVTGAYRREAGNRDN